RPRWSRSSRRSATASPARAATSTASRPPPRRRSATRWERADVPLAFVSSVLAAEGALVEEVDPRAAQVILPEGLRLELDLPEAPLLATDGRDGSVACGHGTELFQALVRRA